MHRVCMTLVLLAAVPLAARAEPISVLQSGTNATLETGATLAGFSIDMGELNVTGGEASAIFFVSGLTRKVDYTASLTITNAGGLEGVTMEVLDPLDEDDPYDPTPQPAYVPAGYSTSNMFDGFSFAQDSGLTRSATFAGGSGVVTADETTHRADILLFSGLSGAEEARLTFGFRDRIGQRGFLVRVSAIGSAVDAANSPEPASMLLLGSGLAGVLAMRRRARRRA